MRATDAMTRRVICIQPQESLEDAYAIMMERNIRHLPVLEDGRLVGILSDRDALLHAHHEDGATRVPAIPVAGVMTTEPLTCSPGSTISHIAGLMVDHKIDSVPIIDRAGELVGLVTSTDLLQLLRERDSGEHKVLPFQFNVERDVRRSAAA